MILRFTSLDPAKRCNFRGTVSRGGNYNDRWSVFSLEGAEAYVNAHEDGSNNKNIITKTTFPQADLQPNQVALNTGDNKAGSLLVIPAVPDNNTYGGRFRAWLTPDSSGEYEFFLRCDDQGEFRISADDKFDSFSNADIVADAGDTTAGDTFQEPGFDQSTSIPIRLERGRKYAIQAIWKEGNGSDYCQVAWRKVGDTTPADQLPPIPGQFLSYYGPAQIPLAEPKITKIALQNGQVVLEWTGASLQSSDDLKTWTDETGAASPLSVTPVNKRFYRVKN